MNLKTVLVVGATGATGKHVVQMLLDEGHTVRAVVRSLERFRNLTGRDSDRLEVTEASLLDLSASRTQELVRDCDAVVSCLGHREVWGKPHNLVTESVTRLCQAMTTTNNKKPQKFLLLGTVLAANPNGKDDARSFSGRLFLRTLRSFVPPHADNEMAAAHLYETYHQHALEWCVVRPEYLLDDETVTKYHLHPKPKPGMFDGKTTKRIHVAHFMKELIVQEDLWDEWKFQMPVIIDDENK